MSLEFPAAMPHDDIEELFENVFMVRGSIVLPNGLPISRNMVIVKRDSGLTLINTVRLDERGLQELEALGAVKHVVRIGAFHGIDDPFYVDRYQAELWAPPGITHNLGFETSQELVPSGNMPFEGCSYFHFETANAPEGLLLLEQDGGILVSCDAMQNLAEADHYFTEESAEKMRELGYIKPAAVGVGWLNGARPQPADSVRINALTYQHLLSAHGAPIKQTAKVQFAETFKTLFGI